MYEYALVVSLADTSEITPDIENLIRNAAAEANSRTNASRKGRHFNIGKMINSTHISVQLLSDNEVIPSRALSALSRAMISLDTTGILDGHSYRGCILSSDLKNAPSDNKITSISDVQMLNTITEMLFGQKNMNYRDKQLSRDYSKKIRKLAIEYLNKRTI